MEEIPFDIIRKILLLLAVKDLLRFRCVLKFFKSLIDSPDFINYHLSLSKKTHTNLYGIYDFVNFDHPEFNLFDVSNYVNNFYESVAKVNRPPVFDPAILWTVEGSCNGLIALSSDSRLDGVPYLTFWNPFTRKSKILTFLIPDTLQMIFGFGYDSKTDDYKLVCIAENRDLDVPYGKESVKTAVYSLKANSWKEIKTDWFLHWEPYDTGMDHRSVLVNNALNWRICGREGTAIVAFDLLKEEFDYVPMLECWESESYGMTLSVLDGCLMLSYVDCRDGAYAWVMKEYGVKESWTKFLSFSWFSVDSSWLRLDEEFIPLAYSRDRKKVLLNHQTEYCDLFWYDLSTGEVESCVYFDNYMWRGYMITFVGSLVSLNESPLKVNLKRKIRFNQENVKGEK